MKNNKIKKNQVKTAGPDLVKEVPNLNQPTQNNDKEKAFHKDLSKLVEQHQITNYAGVFIVNGRTVLVYNPDMISAGRLLNKAYMQIREQVLGSMGEKSN